MLLLIICCVDGDVGYILHISYVHIFHILSHSKIFGMGKRGIGIVNYLNNVLCIVRLVTVGNYTQ